MAAKAERCLGPGFKVAVLFPMPFKDEFGAWHQAAEDSLMMHIRRDPVVNEFRYVDVMLAKSEVDMPDELFAKRIIAPILAAFERANA